MAKAHNKTVQAALTRIMSTGRATLADKPLVDQGLIEVNTDDVVNGEAAARLTQKGIDGMPKSAATATTQAAADPASTITLIDGIELPATKRGGFGREAKPSKYPFATMGNGQSFFVANSEVEGGDALKKLSSTVSNANNKNRTPTGEMQTVVRTVRGEGNKAVLNADGSKQKASKDIPVYKQDKKFTIRPVKAGVVLGTWTAPADGVVIKRIV